MAEKIGLLSISSVIEKKIKNCINGRRANAAMMVI
jgi:hypothetical protein